jgi:hypothetical protein
MTVRAAVGSVQGGSAAVDNRFQVGGCGRAGFRPDLSVGLLGPTHRGAHPRLRATLTARPGDASARRIALTLPPTELLDSRSIGFVCAAAQFDAGSCPAGSAVGRLMVRSPLLDAPLRGPVFLRAGDRRLPSLAASLSGAVDLEVTGQIDSRAGRLRTTFAGLPDLPWSRIELVLDGGKRGLLVNSGGFCTQRQRVRAVFKAHSGKVSHRAEAVKSDCGK